MLKKTMNRHSIACKDGSHIVYNTLLGNPLVLDKAGYAFFDGLPDVIDETAYEGEQLDALSTFEESWLLLRDGQSESGIIARRQQEHLGELARGKTIKFLDLRVCEKCNFACRHCISGQSRQNGIMSLEVATGAIDHIAAFVKAHQENPKLDLHYGNAEPLLAYRLIRKIQAHVRQHHADMEWTFTLNTNLSLLTEEIAKFFDAEGISVYVSLDGNRQANDAIRVQKDGSGTYDLILAKLDLLAQHGRALDGVSVTITDDNFSYVDVSFVKWCVDRGFTSIAMDFDLVNPLLVPIENRTELLVAFWRECKRHDIEFFGTWTTPFLNLSNRSFADKHYAFCRGIHGESFSVSPNGDMFICGSSTTKLGHYSKIDQVILPGGTLYELVKSNLVGANPHCRGCIIEGPCIGQCRVTHEHSPEKVREQCEVYCSLTQTILRVEAETLMTQGAT